MAGDGFDMRNNKLIYVAIKAIAAYINWKDHRTAVYSFAARTTGSTTAFGPASATLEFSGGLSK